MRCNKRCPLYPNSDRESGLSQKAMSALASKADVCGATSNVRFGPKADIRVMSVRSYRSLSSFRKCSSTNTRIAEDGLPCSGVATILAINSESGTRSLTRPMSPIGQNTALVCFSMLTLVSASKADNCDSLAVFDGEDCVGHIMRTPKSPPGKPWFWTIFVSDRHSSTVDRGYAATREQAMADFEAQWLRLPRSVEKERASGTIRPRLVTQTPHQKSTQLN